jgi:hypothetical protein
MIIGVSCSHFQKILFSTMPSKQSKKSAAQSARGKPSGPRAFAARIPPPIGVVKNREIFTPATLRRTLRYSDYQALAGTSGALGAWIFRVNGVFDPDVSFGGHQPMGFDQMTPLYGTFTVASARITIDCVATSVPVCFGVAITSTVGALYTNYNSYIESGTAPYKILDTEASMNRITATVDVAKWLGVKDIMDRSALSGSPTADPTQQLYFQVFAQDVNKTSTANAELNVVIDYDIIFSNPTAVAAS